MLTAAAIGYMIVLIVFHELGHVVAMKYYGLPIATFGIGWPIVDVGLKFRLPGRERTILALHPVFVGAYVALTPLGEHRMERLPYKKGVVVSGAGVWVNFVISLLLWWFIKATTQDRHSLLRPRDLLITALAAALLAWPPWFCRYVFPAIGPFALIALVWALWNQYAYGILGILTVGMTKWAQNWHTVCLFTFRMALVTGILNSTPFFPLDGSYAILKLLRGKPSQHAKKIGTVLFMAVFIWVNAADVWRVISKFL